MIRLNEILRTENLSKHFGGLKAVDGVSISVEEEGILGIIGPNGAGKTTLFNLITGYLKPTKGQIFFRNDRIDPLEPHQIARQGVARTFQIVRPFSELTVLENVLMGKGHNYYDSFRALCSQYMSSREKALELLDFVDLRGQADSYAGTLPIGLQRRLEIARVLALDPSLILLDEPVAGLTEGEMRSLKELFKQLVNEGIVLVLVEHTMSFVMDMCDRLIVLDRGSVISRGGAEQVQNDPKVLEAYLGTEEALEEE